MRLDTDSLGSVPSRSSALPTRHMLLLLDLLLRSSRLEVSEYWSEETPASGAEAGSLLAVADVGPLAQF